MKKIVCMIFVSCVLMLTLCGCANTESHNDQEIVPVETAPPEMVSEPASEIPAIEPPKSLEDARGMIRGEDYLNRYFEIKAKIPADKYLVVRGQEFDDRPLYDISYGNGDANAVTNGDLTEGEVTDFILYDLNKSLVYGLVTIHEKQDDKPEFGSPDAFINNIANNVLELWAYFGMEAKVIRQPSQTTFAGKDCATLLVSSNKDEETGLTYNRMLVFEKGDYLYILRMQGFSEVQIQEMLNCFEATDGTEEAFSMEGYIVAEPKEDAVLAAGKENLNRYTNELFGIQITLPETWEILPVAYRLSMVNKSLSDFDDVREEDVISACLEDVGHITVFNGAFREGTTKAIQELGVQVETLKMPPGGELLEDDLATFILNESKMMMRSANCDVVDENIDKFDLDGVACISCWTHGKTKSAGNDVYQRCVIFYRGGYLMTITTAAYSQEHINEMWNMVDLI